MVTVLWDALTRSGNRAFERRDFTGARRVYRRAVAAASRQLQPLPADDCAADEALAAYVVSCQNLADTHAAMDDHGAAVAQWLALHDRLTELIASCRGRPALLAAALRHDNRTRMELLHHLRDRAAARPGLAPEDLSPPCTRLADASARTLH